MKKGRNTTKRRPKPAPKPRRALSMGSFKDQADGGPPAATDRGVEARRRREKKDKDGGLRCFRCGARNARACRYAGSQSFNFCDRCRPADWTLAAGSKEDE